MRRRRRSATRRGGFRGTLAAVALAAAVCSPVEAASTGGSMDPVLSRYVEIGLRENLALRQEEFSYRLSASALDEARGLFMPQIGIDARYSRAGGGRLIEFPVGDLLNPVYGSLNQLFAANGLPQRDFPVLENELIPFLREEEHDTKVRLVQPLFEPSVWYNYRIRSNNEQASRASRDAFRRRLASDIQTAWFNWLKAVEVVEMLVETRDLLEENLRVSESLLRNGRATADVVYRAEAELDRNEEQTSQARMTARSAASYFNFLLNRPLDEPIEGPAGELSTDAAAPGLEEASVSALENREEILGLEKGIEAAEQGVKLRTSGYLPSVALVFDYGFQGEEYRFTEDDDYWMGSIVFTWTLFDGLRREAGRQQAVIDRRLAETRLEEARERILLEVTDAYDRLGVARQTIETARSRSRSASKSFEIVRKKYNNGMTTQVEFLDARATLTGARTDLIIAEYDFHIRRAEYYRAAALLDFHEGGQW